jgi:ABC-type amino acid transport system permease subunit
MRDAPYRARKAIWMKTASLLLLFVVAAGSSVSAHPHRTFHDSSQAAWSSAINCETVRSYVSQVGLAQARALARASGMTASQEWRARQCLAKGD